MSETDQIETIMNVVNGYLEMLHADLRDARISGDSELISELEGVVAQLEEASEFREEINDGIEQELSNGREDELNREISSINEEFIIERAEYFNNIVNCEDPFVSRKDSGMVIDEVGKLDVNSSGIISFIAGMMMYCFSEQI